MPLELVLGPMRAGKSTEIRRRVARMRAVGRSVLVITHSKDRRFSETAKVVTHDSLTVEANFASQLAPLAAEAEMYHLVVVDEIQFFEDPDDVVAFVTPLLKASCELVMVGLDGTFERKPWPVVTALLPLARCVTKLTAVCMRCKERDAAFTAYAGPRLTGVVNPGTKGYESCCEMCWTPPEFRDE